MSPFARLDVLAERLGRPDVWGKTFLRLLGIAASIVGAGFLMAASIAPTAAVASATVSTVREDLLTFDPLPDSIGEQPERSVVLAANGKLLAVLHGVENRELVPLSDVPQHVQQAVIATEDEDFWTHQGVNWRAVSRAFVHNLQAGRVTSGASTITQQLVKQVVLKDNSITYQRKLREAYYATQLEDRLTKEEILYEYLNLAYFGHGVYGIGTASEYYFDKPVSKIDTVQGALLAGMIRAPNINDPIRRPKEARGRRNIVLRQMADQGYISRPQLRRWLKSDLRLDVAKRPPAGKSFFVTYVTELLKQQPALGATREDRAAAILRGGLTIRTTLNPGLQKDATRAIRSVLRDRNGPQAAVTAVDPRTGEILAIGVGPKPFGKGKGRSSVTPAVRGLGSPAGRQPGSAFKPFQLVAALEDGISPAYTFKAGSSYTFTQQECNPPDYSPGNYADATMGVLNMYEAIALSSNTYFAHLEDLTGPERLVETAQRMGITSDLTPFCSTVLGTEEVFGLDMASAYGTLANEGQHCEPFAISEVLDRHGRTLLRNTPNCAQAVQRDIAVTAIDLLRGPIENGTATTNGQIGRPAAGKTGTTDDYGNAWFVGFVPQLSASTWVGYPARTKTLYDGRCGDGRVTGGCLPTMIWSKFMKRAANRLDLPPRGFPEPPPPPKAQIPNVVGRTVAEAQEILRQAQFRMQARSVASSEPRGTVLKQQPGAGSSLELGAAVVVNVSDGSIEKVVPDLLGMTEQEASNALAGAGLLGQAEDVLVDNPDLDGIVVSQEPPGGTPVDEAGDIIVRIGVFEPSSSGNNGNGNGRGRGNNG